MATFFSIHNLNDEFGYATFFVLSCKGDSFSYFGENFP